MYDLIALYNRLEKRPIFLTFTAATGSLTLQAGATATLYTHDTTTQYGVLSGTALSGQDAGAAAAPRAWINIDTEVIGPASAALTDGLYDLQIKITAAGSDGLNRDYVRNVLIVVGLPSVRTVYPTVGYLQWHLWQRGLMSNPPTAAENAINLKTAVLDVVADWERMVSPLKNQTVPYLVEAADSTRYYNGPGGPMLPIAPMISITSVTVGLSATNPTGTALTANTNYWLDPLDSLPTLYLVLDSFYGDGQRSIKVIGRRGRVSTIPDDVWEILIDEAVRRTLPATATSAPVGNLTSIRQDDVTHTYSDPGKSGIRYDINSAEGRFHRAAMRVKGVSVS